MKNAVIISGWHSGPNPSSGLGIAKSIKESFPNLKIIALDYSSRSTGLYDPIVDERIIRPEWDDVSVRKSISEVIDSVQSNNALFISGLDVEIIEIAKEAQSLSDSSFLLPPYNALSLTSKPAEKLAEMLGLLIPKTAVHSDIMTSAQKSEAFGWPVLVKGRHYEAKVASNYKELVSCIRYIVNTWGDTPIIQQYIYGREECISFAAYKGELLGTVVMRKTAVTSQGKVWSGRIDEINPEFLLRLSSMVKCLNWTGGGEVETIWDDIKKTRYLIDFNPRFPAWIYGATVCGVNLPGRLVAVALSERPPKERPRMGGFVRVVNELPISRVERNVFLNTRVNPQISLKGHPSGLSVLSKRGSNYQPKHMDAQPETDDECIVALNRVIDAGVYDNRPMRLYLSSKVTSRVERLKSMCEDIHQISGITGRIFYSLKTNPSSSILQDILNLNCGIETISMDEYLYALQSGFQSNTCILNGPGKWWGYRNCRSIPEPLAIQCDSLCDLRVTMAQMVNRNWNNCQIGIRISPFSYESRFGIDVHTPQNYAQLCSIIPKVAKSHSMGIHFHFAESTIGVDEWLQEIEAIAILVHSISLVTGVNFNYFDFGGGWRTRDIEVYCDTMAKAVSIVHRINPSIQSVYVEPGKLIVEDATMLLAQVIGFRERGKQKDAIISAAINDMPDIASFPHDILWYSKTNKCWLSLSDGSDRVLGRICMESDIIRSDVTLPTNLNIGDYVAIKSVGAYDSSMAFTFGEGR